MTSLVLRLALGSGRSAAGRLVLIVLGTAAASALLLVATGVATLDRSDLSIGPSSGFVTYPDGTGQPFDEPGSAGPITTSYLVEPELRRGVALGFVLCVVPLLVFVAVATRVAVRRRDDRLAALRLAGASNGQVRALAALDAAVAAAAGAVLGAVLFLAGRGTLLQLAGDPQLVAIADRLAPPLPIAVLVLAVLVAATTAASTLLLRSLRITPLGVVRKAPRRRPRPWGLALLVGGLLAFATLALTGGVPDTVLGDVSLGAALAVSMIGLVTCGPWLTSLTGRALGRVSHRPAALLAGRRLEDEPRAQARAMSAVVLVVLSATIALVVLQDFRLADRGHDEAFDDFYLQGFTLTAIGMAFSLGVAACGLLLTTLEGLLERRRTLGALSANGVPRSVLRRAVLLQVGLPVLPAATLAVLAGLAVTGSLFHAEQAAAVLPVALLALPAAAAGVSLLAAACTLPALPRSADLAALRQD
jgi:hypothetical protein